MLEPKILHYKYSLEDGHVTPQISQVEGFTGIMLVSDAKQQAKKSPFKYVVHLNRIRRNPRLLKKNKVVAVHAHHGILANKLLFLKKECGLPLFVGFRGKDATAYPKKSEHLKELEKVFRAGDLFFPVCQHLKKEIVKLGCPEEKIRVLYGGVNLAKFRYWPRTKPDQGPIRLLAVGRFVPKKGFADLLHAFAWVKKQNKNIKLTLIGTGPCEEDYRKWIHKYGLQRDVEIVPWTDYKQMPNEYHRSHIFCAPSCTDNEGNQEGIPNTLKEAMATGMPVISTVHAGIPELVENGRSGLLVPEESSEQLAKAMIWLVEHPEIWEGIGKEARQKIERDFNLEKQLEKQKRFYNEILQ